MKFFYCTVCDHYHVCDDRLPCNMLGRASKRAMFDIDPVRLKELKEQSQRMLNSRRVFLQTLRQDNRV